MTKTGNEERAQQRLELYLSNLAALKAELNSLSTEGDHEYVYSDGYYATLTWLLHHWLHLANGSVTWSGGTILDTNMLPKPFNALHCVIHRPQNRKGPTLTKHYEMNGHSRSPHPARESSSSRKALTRSSLCFNFPRAWCCWHVGDDARGPGGGCLISWRGQGRGDREIIETVLI